MFFSRRAGHKYVRRSEPLTTDFNQDVLTQDNVWHNLDLSGIIPKNTQLILLRGVCKDAVFTTGIEIRYPDIVSNLNITELRSITPGNKTIADLWVTPNPAGVVQYRIQESGWDDIDLTVGGWFV